MVDKPVPNKSLYLNLYLKNWKDLVREGETLQIKTFGNFIRHYFKWHQSLKKDYWEGPLQDGIPWLTFSAIDFLEKNLVKSDKVFEYGTGGSTIFFAERVSKVVSVDHDPEWFQLAFKQLNKRNCINVKATCVEAENLLFDELPEPDDYETCYSSTGLCLKKYVNSINEYPEQYFDLVVIDGRARPSCIKQAKSKIKPGKYLLLDNSERSHYQLAINHLLQGWNRKIFNGPTPYLKWFTQTSVWQKTL